MKRLCSLLLLLLINLIACSSNPGFNETIIDLLNISEFIKNHTRIPDNPADLQATAISENSIDLVWKNFSNNEKGFYLERSDNNPEKFGIIAILSPGSSNFSDKGLNPSTNYYYRIMAFNTAGKSGYSNISGASTGSMNQQIPNSPSMLTLANITAGGIRCSWNDNSNNESGFIVQRSDGNNSSFKNIATTPSDSNTYDDISVSLGIHYYYRIKAASPLGDSGFSNISDILLTSLVPNPPDDLTAQTQSSSQIQIRWSDNSTNETGFSIERKVHTENSFTVINSVGPNYVNYLDSGLNHSTTYVYRIRALNDSGYSGYSNEAEATTATGTPNAPSAAAARGISAGEIIITWTDNSLNETGFFIERRASNSQSFGPIANLLPDATSYTDSSLSQNTTYCYRIRACNSNGCSSYSPEICGTTLPTNYTQIIADHTVVEQYANIPQIWINEAKKMMVNIPGESHGRGYMYGLKLLEAQDPRFASSITWNGAPEAACSTRLRGVRTYRDSGGHWSETGGEEDFFTSSNAISMMNTHLSYMRNTLGNPVSVFMFGWCWDMTWHNNPGGSLDPVYLVHWAGSSVGGPQGDMIWGLDREDTQLTGNSICMLTYLEAVDLYNSSNTSTLTVFTTGPVDEHDADENGYQRHLKHEYIRNYVKSSSSRALFDYADILCYNNAGQLRTGPGWTDSKGVKHVYPIIHTENSGVYDGGNGDCHVNQNGCLRLGKALWWLMARKAGWDGVSQ